jgi:hypothetical protein
MYKQHASLGNLNFFRMVKKFSALKVQKFNVIILLLFEGRKMNIILTYLWL